jgi:REP element-mobilizing transposase RayT
MRSEAEFVRTKEYVEHNPVTAGLVERPEDWRWSSAYRDLEKS